MTDLLMKKFNAEAKVKFLAHLATSGKMKEAADSVGVSGNAVFGCCRADQRFDALVMDALRFYFRYRECN